MEAAFREMQDKLVEAGLVSNVFPNSSLTSMFQDKDSDPLLKELMTVLAKDAGCKSVDEMFDKVKRGVGTFTDNEKRQLISVCETQVEEIRNKPVREIKTILSDTPMFKELCSSVMDKLESVENQAS